MSGALLLSIRPEFAERIFNGTKGVELRRIRPRISTGDTVVVYVSSPVKAVVGTFEAGEVLSDIPRRLWHKVRDMAGISRDQFETYYEGAKNGYGIMCNNPKTLDKPLELGYLRRQWQGFHPPQLYRYLSSDELDFIKESQTD